MNLLADMIAGWAFTRSESHEILASLSDEQLQFQPTGAKWRPLYYQFGCMARTQLVYAAAVESGVMDYSLFSSSELPSKTAIQDGAGLAALLNEANKHWLRVLKSRAAEDAIRWPDHTRSVARHIGSLAEHERLHHGQIIGYFSTAGINLPAGFKGNWAL